VAYADLRETESILARLARMEDARASC